MEDELFLKFLGKRLKNWELRDVLYAHRPKSFFLFLLVKTILMELNCFLCNIKCKILLENVETKVRHCDDYACQNVQNLIFKDG